MNKSSVFWGTFLIMLGGLFLLRSINTLDSDFSIFIRLWPVFLIFWGLSIIHFPQIAKNILAGLSAVFLALFIFAIFSHGWSFTKTNIFRWQNNNKIDKDEQVYEFSKQKVINFDTTVTAADLKINFGAGNLQIGNKDDNSILINGSDFNLEHENILGNSNRVALSVSSPGDDAILDRIQGEFGLEILLNRNIEWYIQSNVGAADVDFDFSELNTPKISVDCGASDIELKLGAIAKTQEIFIDCGASDIKIKIPELSGCRIIAETFLSDEDFDGFEKKGNVWQTKNIYHAGNIIDINLDGGVSSFKVIRY